jgi:hypothetical protein
MLAMPLQILLSLVLLAMVISSLYLYWISQFENSMIFFFSHAPESGAIKPPAMPQMPPSPTLPR